MMSTTASTLPAPWRFPLLLALLLAVLVAVLPTDYRGDSVEYTLDTVAIASHGTPDIRLDDIARTRALLGDAYRAPFDELERGMRAGDQDLYAAFTRGKDGDVYPIHFFGYPLLAAAPFKLFEMIGAPPFKAFVAVNLAAVFVLGLALRRFFGSERRAWAGLALFMLCGGVLFWRWSSPECLSAALLLAAMLYFTAGAPLRGAMLAGLASWQNPTILFFFGFAPLLKLCLDWQRGAGLMANLRAQVNRANIVGLAAGVAVFSVPVLFNLYQYGVPNIIARKFSDPTLVGGERLLSFFFDLNQGMAIGLPGLIAAVLLLCARKDLRARSVLSVALLFLLALAVPALAVLNWNSDAAGMMRYVFWSSMPLLFVLLALLRDRAWPLPLVAGVAALQALAMLHAASYHYTTFSPLARQVLAHAPGLYHPEPEIFAERTAHHDNYIRADEVYVYRIDGAPVKALLNVANAGADAALCGAGAMLAPDNAFIDATRGWRYVDAPLRCAAGELVQRSFQFDDLKAGAQVELGQGWSGLEANGPGWNGVWSNGPRSQLVLHVDTLQAQQILVSGAYLQNQGRTRVRVNGVDLGWHQLDREGPLSLPPAAVQGGRLAIELEHESPRSPGASDPRQLAFFLREINVRAKPAAQK
ncbi:hypothetical protein [Massilia sp. HP4]|uniref:hypothetical protein n=1 Tax=Massilia sp. HP4 TaxID=2562316 RepID=UPI0010C0129D|nr:hypothetical protein [Massilia sp. HP4]